MKKLYILVCYFIVNVAVGQNVYFDYDNAGNRIKRSTTQPGAKCYTMASPVNGTYLTNYNGLPKLQPVNSSNTASQIWKFEIVGGYYKIVSQGGTTSIGVGYALGVVNAGNTADTPVKLMSYGTGGDHLLWSKSMADNGEVFTRKNSNLNFGVTQGFGTGVGITGTNASISDLNLGYDPDLIYGGTKWVLNNVGCPSSVLREAVVYQKPYNDNSGSLITVFPNPSSGTVKINLNLNGSQEANFSVFKSDGKTVYNKKITTQHFQNQLNLQGLESGIYIFRLTQGNNIITKKVMVSK